MSIWMIILIVFGVLILGGFVAMLIYTLPIAKKVYHTQLVRTSPEKWARVCSDTTNAEQVAMWEAGIQWAKPHQDKMREVHIVSEGLNLYGEYYDFGSDRCVIILPGRCESLVYSYFFAAPYEKAGCNILVIDTRCHGKSDGIYNTIGVKERSDVLAWAAYAHDTLHNDRIYIHGICIGTSAGLFALTDPRCPDYMAGLITEGCYVSFRETFKRHMIAEKRPLFPVLDLVMLLINRHTGTNVYRDKPIRAMKRVKPQHRMLFLYGKQDIFSIPEKTKKLFAACASRDKKLVWFDKGSHSHLRINNPDQYDQAIVDFLQQ